LILLSLNHKIEKEKRALVNTKLKEKKKNKKIFFYHLSHLKRKKYWSSKIRKIKRHLLSHNSKRKRKIHWSSKNQKGKWTINSHHKIEKE
jgi:hypothetical protein